MIWLPMRFWWCDAVMKRSDADMLALSRHSDEAGPLPWTLEKLVRGRDSNP
jgi:hypothetical protein